ncbi:MAG: hypothetical protein KatS3mg102_0391 [Planctomycetota bacterium]|nr:MAG: hypothetical protein KatS3mg102_0391 [Planctomycetota bacterium]
MRSRLLQVTLALCAAWLQYACAGTEPAPELAGRYVASDPALVALGHPGEAELVFLQDGRFELWAVPDEYPLSSQERLVRAVHGRYAVSAARLTLWFDGSERQFRFRLAAGRLTLVDERAGTRMEFRRREP